MKRLLLCATLLLAGCPKAPLKFSPDALPDGEVGKPYRAEITVTGNTTPVGGMGAEGEAGTLPPGLELHFTREAKAGVLEGTPTKAGSYAFRVGAWCYGTNVSGQKGEREYRVTVR